MPKSSSQQPSFQNILRYIFQENTYFFCLSSFFVALGGITLMLIEQGDLLEYFSENRTDFCNFFFKNGTKLGEEWAYIGFLVLFLFIRFRYALLIPLIGILVTLVSYVSKSIFQHPRPSVYYKELGIFQDINLVEGVHVVKGLTSFPSGHTMSAFALFTLIALILKQKKGMAILLFFSALVVAISRIYLVQHFLEDVYLGGIMGIGIGTLVYALQKLVPINSANKIDQKIDV